MSMTFIVYAFVAMLLGSVIPLQAGINATMGRSLGHPLWGGLTNTLVASLTLGVFIVALRVTPPTLWSATKAPWWAWTGGVLGASLVFGSLFLAPKMGAASFVTMTIFGTVIASLLIDHFGLIGFNEHPVSLAKLAGAALVVVGMVIVQSQR